MYLLQKAFGWGDVSVSGVGVGGGAGGAGGPGGGHATTGGSPGGAGGGQAGAVAAAGQGAQGLVHWMSVMAEHMDPAVQHYMSWNQEVSHFLPFSC